MVFGAGGDRDRGKRPIMGAIAAAGADVVIASTTTRAARSRRRSAPKSWRRRWAPSRSAIAARDPCGGRDDRRVGDAARRGQGHETGQIVGDGAAVFRPRRSRGRLFAIAEEEMTEPLWTVAEGCRRRRRAARRSWGGDYRHFDRQPDGHAGRGFLPSPAIA
ncbi:MAG: hypothetical protein R3D02_00680 [Hyphomicrobiales bacterium]